MDDDEEGAREIAGQRCDERLERLDAAERCSDDDDVAAPEARGPHKRGIAGNAIGSAPWSGRRSDGNVVIRGLVPRIHVFSSSRGSMRMAGTRPATTIKAP